MTTVPQRLFSKEKEDGIIATGKIAIQASWNRNKSNELQFQGASGKQLKTVRLDRRAVGVLRGSIDLSLRNPQIGFYKPQASLYPDISNRRFRAHRMEWAEHRQISGSLEIWGPAIPGTTNSLPEPRMILFAGEEAYLVLRLRNGGKEPLVVRGVRLAHDNLNTIRFEQSSSAFVAPQAETECAVPIRVSASVKAGFFPVSVRIPCRMGRQRFTLTHDLHVAIGRLVSFKQQADKPHHDGSYRLALSLAADVPGGFREIVSANLLALIHVTKDGAVRFGFSPLSYEAKVILSDGGRALHATHVPKNLYLTSYFGDLTRRVGRRAFQVTTMVMMAALAEVGVQATKIAIAAAAQLLGPEVGVPVTIALYTPSVEAWFAKAATVTLGASGWELNGDLYDQIFPPTA